VRYSAHDGKLHLIHFFSLTSSGNELSTDILVLIFVVVLSFFLSLLFFARLGGFLKEKEREGKEREKSRTQK